MRILETPFGLLAVVELGTDELTDALFANLPSEEQALAQRFAPRRRRTFAGGRHALRAALTAVGRPCADAILRNDRGAPALPNGVRASVSHTDEVACAIAALDTTYHVGIDIESIARVAGLGAKSILTPREIGRLPGEGRTFELALKFSLKESLYKAIDPFLRSFVDFTEVEVWTQPRGTASFSLLDVPDAASLSVEGWWTHTADHVITSARARRSQ